MKNLILKALRLVTANNFPSFKKLDLAEVYTLKEEISKVENENEVIHLLHYYGYSITDFGWSLLFYLKNGKLSWEDVAIFQSRYKPKGRYDIVSPDWLARNIVNYGIENKVPRGNEFFKL